MKRVMAVGVVVLGLWAGTAGRAQQLEAFHAAGPLPEFEVATIKPLDRSNPTPFAVYAPGMRNPTHIGGRVDGMIAEAYQVTGVNPRVIGGPDWLSKSIYRIEAKIPDDVFAAMQKMASEERVKEQALMLQQLLAERFQLKVHFERREFPDYELVPIDKGKVKLTKAADETTVGGGGMVLLNDGVRLRARNVSMQGLALTLEGATSRMVVDKTGIDGRYDVEMKFSPMTTVFAGHGFKEEETASGAPSIFEVLKNAGLKLVPSKAMVEVVVIDHVEMPSEN